MRTNTDGTPFHDEVTPVSGVADGLRVNKPRKAAGGTPLTPRTSGTPEEFLADALFRRLDADGDGELTGGEIPTALRGEVNGRGGIDPVRFAKVFQATVQRMRASNAAAIHAWFPALDTDGNGLVSRSEWRAAGRSAADFERIDADGDGVLTLREVRAFAAQIGQPVPIVSTTPAASSATHADGTPPSTTAVTTTGTKPPSRADALFAHYAAVASGSQPNPTRVTAARPGGAGAPPAAAPAAALPAASPLTPALLPPGEYATLPLPFIGVTYWEQRDTENRTALLAGEQPNVLFLGDSITDFLRTGAGAPLWDEYYDPLGASTSPLAASAHRTSSGSSKRVRCAWPTRRSWCS